jgi:hypothetical protein
MNKIVSISSCLECKYMNIYPKSLFQDEDVYKEVCEHSETLLRSKVPQLIPKGLYEEEDPTRMASFPEFCPLSEDIISL